MNQPRIDGLWHATAMADAYDALLGPLQRLFGAVVMHDTASEDPAVGRRGGMVWLGDNSIEIGAPLGARSPVRSFVENLGGGMHSIALRVADCASTRRHLKEQGIEPVAAIRDEVLFTHPRDTGGLMLEWSAIHTDDDPRWGFPLKPSPVEPLTTVTQYAYVTAAVADPAATAEQLAGLFGTEVLRGTPGARPDAIAAMVSLVDSVLVLFQLRADGEAWPWGRPPARPRFHGHGLVVDDLDGSLAALAEVGIGVVAELEGAALLDPAALPLPTFLCAELLPEDPRRAARASVRQGARG